MADEGGKEQRNSIPWIPIAKNITRLLPKNRSFTELEAVFCLQLDHNNGSPVSIMGYSKLWGWSRRQVRSLFERLSIEITYPENTQKVQKQLGQIRPRHTPEGRTDQRTENGQINFINFNQLQEKADRKRTEKRTHLKRIIENREKDYGKNPKIRVFREWFSEKFKTKFEREYLVGDYKKCGGQIQKLLKLPLSWEDLQYVTIEFLLDEDPFLVGDGLNHGAGHSIGMLLSRVNQNRYHRYLEPEFREEKRYHIIDEKGN